MIENDTKPTEEAITPEDLAQNRSMGLSYFKLSSITPGSPAELEVVGMTKVVGGKYTIRGKTYSLRVSLGSGKVMDVTSAPVAGELTRLGYDAHNVFKPFSVRITRKSVNKIGETPYILEKIT